MSSSISFSMARSTSFETTTRRLLLDSGSLLAFDDDWGDFFRYAKIEGSPSSLSMSEFSASPVKSRSTGRSLSICTKQKNCSNSAKIINNFTYMFFVFFLF